MPQNNTIEKKELRESEFINMFKNSEIEISIHSTAFSWSPSELKNIFLFRNIIQKQLPKMPKEYIFKVLMSEVHRNIMIFYKKVLIGGLCYRPFFDQGFAEIVFLAVDADKQIQGFGSFLMDFYKEHFKLEIYRFTKNLKENTKINSVLPIYDPNLSVIDSNYDYTNPSYKIQKHPLYIMTYADNYAIGFFKKQGFSSIITFKNWIGYIKDYEGGTLVQNKILWKINYIRKSEFIEKGRQELIQKISNISEFNILRTPIKVNNIFDVPGFKEAKLTKEMLMEEEKGSYLKKIFMYITSDLKSDTHSWPFLEPVKKEEVTDYYLIIKEPMDLRTLTENIKNDKYSAWDEYEKDVMKIFRNCNIYNRPNSQYCKCSDALENRFKLKAQLVKKILLNKNY